MGLKISTVHALPKGKFLVNAGGPDAVEVSPRPDDRDENAPALLKWLRVNRAAPFHADLLPIDVQIAEASATIRSFATARRAEIAQHADRFALSRFPAKAARADRVARGVATADEIAGLQREADKRGRGESAVALAEKQLTKAAFFEVAGDTIDGMETAALDAVEAAKSAAALAVILEKLQVEAEAAFTNLTKGGE